MLHLILNNLRKRKVQTFAIFFSVLASIAVLFALALVSDGVSRGLTLSEERLGADLVVVPVEAESELDDDDILFAGSAACYYMDESVVDEITETSGVERVTAQFFCQTLSGSACCTDGIQARIVGFDPDSDWVIEPWMTDSIDEPLADNDVIIGANITATDGENKISVLGKQFTIVSHLDFTGTSLDHSIMMNIDAARTLAEEKSEYSYLWERYGPPDDLVTAVLVDLDEGVDPDITAQLISYRTKTSVIQASDALGEVQSQMNVIVALMLGVAILLSLVTIIQLFARFYSMAWDRKSEFGLYKALGAKQGTLRRIVFGEMLLLVLAGSIIGIVLGIVLYNVMIAALTAQSTFPYVSPGIVTGVFWAVVLVVIALAVGFVATAMPVRQIGKISPTIAMQRGNID